MIQLFAPLFMVAAPIEQNVSSRVDPEAALFLEQLAKENPPSKCLKCRKPDGQEIRTAPSKEQLRLFISFSVPLETWKDFSHALVLTGGTFVLRGIPSHSFASFAGKVKALRDAGVHAPIAIDPEAFDRFNIEAVPAFVLQEGDKIDKIAGNIPLIHVLRTFAEKGETSHLSRTLLHQMEAR